MSEDLRPMSADRMPTLTEVLEFEDHSLADAQAEAASASEDISLSVTLPAASAVPAFDAQGLVNEVLAE